MAYKYRRAPNDFYLIGNVNEVRETQYGIANHGNIIFPGVSSCTVLALLLADNTVLGLHFAKTDLVIDVDSLIARVNVVRNQRAVNKIYAMGALKTRGSGFPTEPRYKWPTQLTTFNLAFGRAAGDPILGFDQKNDDLSYRAQRAGDVILWFKKPTGVALDMGQWEPISNDAITRL